MNITPPKQKPRKEETKSRNVIYTTAYSLYLGGLNNRSAGKKAPPGTSSSSSVLRKVYMYINIHFVGDLYFCSGILIAFSAQVTSRVF